MAGERPRHPGGRPRIDDAKQVRVTLTMPAEYLAWIREEGRGNASEGLRRLLEELDHSRGAASTPTSGGSGASR